MHALGHFYDWHSVYQVALDRVSRFNNAFTHNSKVSSLAPGRFYDWHSVYQVALDRLSRFNNAFTHNSKVSSLACTGTFL